MEPTSGEWPWVVLHNGHPAWYQRSLMIGDFAPGKKPLPNYVIYLDGTMPSFKHDLVCGSCGKKPKNEDLDVKERSTGHMGFMDAYKRGKKPWSKASVTKTDTCYFCNHPFVVAPKKVKLKDVAQAAATVSDEPDDEIDVCVRCETHLLARSKIREAKVVKVKEVTSVVD